MSQERIFDYRAPRSTHLLNNKFVGLMPPGVYNGYHVSTAGEISPGVLLTKDGVKISEDWPVKVNIPPNNSSHPRTDLIFCSHEYVQTVPPPAAIYEIIEGNPGPETPVPHLPDKAILLAVGTILPGSDRYSNVRQAGPPDYAVNACFNGNSSGNGNNNGIIVDVDTDNTAANAPAWRIIKGDLAAFRTKWDINTGEIFHYAVAPGKLRDNDIIDWGKPVLTVSADGVNQILDLAGQGRTTETVKVNADNIAAEIANRKTITDAIKASLLTESLQRESTDSLIQNQFKLVQGSLGWNDPPVDSIAGLNNRISTIETADGGGLPNHGKRHEAGGADQVDFDKLADGKKFKKMTAQERTKIQKSYSHTNNQAIHLSSSQVNDLTGGQNSKIHCHDDIYGRKDKLQEAIDAKSDWFHNHDNRYLYKIFSKSITLTPSKDQLVTTLDLPPDHIALSYNYVNDKNLPEQPTYAMGAHTTKIHCLVMKKSNGNSTDKDYQIFLWNKSDYKLWINIDIFGID